MQLVDRAAAQHRVGQLADELRLPRASHLGERALLVRRIALLELLGEDDLLRVDVGERDLKHDPVVHDVHGRPVATAGTAARATASRVSR